MDYDFLFISFDLDQCSIYFNGHFVLRLGILVDFYYKVLNIYVQKLY